MKKPLLFLIVMLCGAQMYAGNYREFLQQGNKWNVLFTMFTTCGSGSAHTISLDLRGDTVIDNLAYRKMNAVRLSVDSEGNQFRDTIYAACLRENVAEQKVYVRYPNQGEELLYNFNAKVGDTVKIVSDYSGYGYTDKTIRFVSGIETYTEGGITGKKIILTDTLYLNRYDQQIKDTVHQKSAIFEHAWLEGIGTLYGPITLSIDNFPPRYYIRSNSKKCSKAYSNMREFTLLCFWRDSTKLYHNSEFTECEYAYKVGIEEQLSDGISIYPNPTKGVVNVKVSSGIEQIELFDAQGKRIMSTTKATLDLSGLPNGLYFVKVHTASDVIKVQKIVKQ